MAFLRMMFCLSVPQMQVVVRVSSWLLVSSSEEQSHDIAIAGNPPSLSPALVQSDLLPSKLDCRTILQLPKDLLFLRLSSQLSIQKPSSKRPPASKPPSKLRLRQIILQHPNHPPNCQTFLQRPVRYSSSHCQYRPNHPPNTLLLGKIQTGQYEWTNIQSPRICPKKMMKGYKDRNDVCLVSVREDRVNFNLYKRIIKSRLTDS